MKGNVDGEEMILSEGREVEATPDEEGFKGAWYTVTILKLQNQNNTQQGKALVQYKNIFKDGNNATPFTENVPISHIRPLPPQPEETHVDGDQLFHVKDVVDAFYLGGWWTGSVSKVLDNPKRYIVSFEDQTEDVEFTSSCLRPHWEWVDGKWVKSSKLKEALVSSNCQEVMELSTNITTKDAGPTFQLERSDAQKCSVKKHESFCVSSRKNEMGLFNVHVKRAATEGDATPLHPSKKSKDGSSGNSFVPESNVKDTDPAKVEGVGEENFHLLEKVHRPLKLPLEGRQHTAADEMDNIKVEAAIEVSEVQKKKKETESSVPKELATECMSGTVGEESYHFIKEENNLQKVHGVSRYKKEDGAETGINRIEQPNLVLEIKQLKLVPRNSQSPSAGKDAAAFVLDEEVFPEEQTAAEAESSASLGQAEGAVVVSATDCQREIIKMAGESSRILHETEAESPLICYKEIHPGDGITRSAVIEENNLGHIPHGFSNHPRDKSLEIVVQSPLVGMAGDNEPQERQDWPFVKSLPMWKAVEPMEIFQVMPQNPHFHPLVKQKEILREGLALGNMLNFASMVQRTSKLTVSDPRNHFTNILYSLPELEVLGFDVKLVRDRISHLLCLKDRHEYLQDHSKEIELMVKLYSDELTKIDEETAANHEKRGELELAKDSKTSQILSLQLSVDVITQCIRSLEYELESLAGSPW